MIACRYQPVSMSIQARENYLVWGYDATGNYFETLGVKPLLGRFFGKQKTGKAQAQQPEPRLDGLDFNQSQTGTAAGTW